MIIVRVNASRTCPARRQFFYTTAGYNRRLADKSWQLSPSSGEQKKNLLAPYPNAARRKGRRQRLGETGAAYAATRSRGMDASRLQAVV